MKWGASIGTSLGIVASAGCDAGTAGACVLANPGIVAGMGAGGTAVGAAADAISDGVNSYVHGNSTNSNLQTYVYELVDRATSDTLKYGITSEQNPRDRYNSDYYNANNADMVVLGSYSTRWMARAEELRLNGNYVINNGSFPPLTFRW